MTTMHEKKTVCARLDNMDAAVEHFKSLGCRVQRQSDRGLMLDCPAAGGSVESATTSFEYAKYQPYE